MFLLKEYIFGQIYFWIKVAHQISTFWTLQCLPEVVEIPHVIFEIRSQFLYKLGTILVKT